MAGWRGTAGLATAHAVWYLSFAPCTSPAMRKAVDGLCFSSALLEIIKASNVTAQKGTQIHRKQMNMK